MATRGAKQVEGKISQENVSNLLHENVSNLLHQIKILMDNLDPSPVDGDKETVSKQSEPRLIAMALREKDVPIFSLTDMETLVKVKERYGFSGRAAMGKNLYGSPSYAAILSEARSTEIKFAD